MKAFSKYISIAICILFVCSSQIFALTCVETMEQLSSVSKVLDYAKRQSESLAGVLPTHGNLNMSSKKRLAAALGMVETQPLAVIQNLGKFRLTRSEISQVGRAIAERDFDLYLKHHEKFPLALKDRTVLVPIILKRLEEKMEPFKDSSWVIGSSGNGPVEVKLMGPEREVLWRGTLSIKEYESQETLTAIKFEAVGEHIETAVAQLRTIGMTDAAISDLAMSQMMNTPFGGFLVPNLHRVPLTHRAREFVVLHLESRRMAQLLPHLASMGFTSSQRLEIAKKTFELHQEGLRDHEPKGVLNPSLVVQYLKQLNLPLPKLRKLCEWASTEQGKKLVDSLADLPISQKHKIDLVVRVLENKKRTQTNYFESGALLDLVKSKTDADRIATAATKGKTKLDESFYDFLKDAPLSESVKTIVICEVAGKMKVIGDLNALRKLNLAREKNRYDALEAFARADRSSEMDALEWKPEQVDAYLDTLSTHKAKAVALLSDVNVDVARHIGKLNIPRRRGSSEPETEGTSQLTTKFELLCKSCEVDPKNFAKSIGALSLEHSLTRDERLTLALIIAEKDPSALDMEGTIHSFGLTEYQRFEVVRIALSGKRERKEARVDRVGGRSTTYSNLLLVGKYGITNPEYRQRLGIEAIRDRPGYTQEGKGLQEYIEQVANFLNLNATQKRALLRVPFAEDPLKFVEAEGNQRSSSSEAEDVAAFAHVRRQFRKYAEKNPDILPPQWVELIWDRVHAQELGFRLLKQLYEITNYDVSKPVPSDSIELVSKRVGWDPVPIRNAELSDTRLGTLFWMALDIQENLSKPAFETVVVDPAICTQPSRVEAFTTFLERVRDLHHLRGNNSSSWRSVLEDLNLNGQTITHESLASLSSRSEDLIVKGLQDLFRGSNLELTYEQIQSLGEKWDGIEPIMTLVARFNGRQEWKAEIPELAAVFEAALRDKFKDYKFLGREGDEHDQTLAAAQMAPLRTEVQKEAWMAERSRMSVYDPQKATRKQAETQQLERVRTVLQDEVAEHLPWNGEVAPAEHAAIIEAALKQQNPMDSLKTLLEGNALKDQSPNVQTGKIIKAIATELGKTDSTEKAKKLAKVLRTWGNAIDVSADLRNDMGTIISNLGNGSGATSKSIVFTTISSHPKLLLMTGNLVGTKTCQSYSDGGYVQTLLGYVKDANVQVLGSWALAPRHFQKANEHFDLVARAIEQGVEIKRTFDGGKRIATFEFTWGETAYTIQTLPLGDAKLRHVVKLGTAGSGQPGIVLEPAKTNHHDAMSIMDRHAIELRNETARDIGGVTNESIKIPESRNDGGVYSDKAVGDGVKTGSYEIAP